MHLASPRHPIIFTTLRTRPALTGIADRWEAIAAESGGSAGPSFVLPWLDVFGANADLHVLAAWSGADLLAVFPLAKTDTNGVVGLEWLHDPHTPLFEPACRRDVIEPVCHALVEWACDGGSEWGRLALGGIRQDHPVREGLLHAIESTGSPVVIHEDPPSRMVETRIPFEEHSQRRGKGFRNRLRVARAATRGHRVEIACIRTEAAFESALPQLRRASEASWQGEAGSGAFAAELDRRFYSAVGMRAAQRDLLRLHVCTVDGELAGYLFEILGNGTSLVLKSEFDQRFARLSVGWHLVKAAYELAHAEGGRSMDFGNWPTPFKDEWATQLLPHWKFNVFRRNWRGRATSSAMRLVGTVHRCAAVMSAEAERAWKAHTHPDSERTS